MSWSTEQAKTESQTGAIFALLLLLGLCVFYWPWLNGSCDFCYSDLTYYFQPFSMFMAEEVKQGRFPLWNPYMYCGMSQIAIPSPGPFYPFTWLHVLLPFSFGLALYLLIHQAIFGIGGFLLIRRFGWSDVAAATTGLALAFCGYMFCLSSNSTLPATIAWLPLGMHCLLQLKPEFLVHNGNPGAARIFWLTGSAMTVAMIVLAGRAELGLPALVTLSVTAAWPVIEVLVAQKFKQPGGAEMREAFFTVLWRVSSIALGLLIAMPTILPTIEWMRVSPRAGGLDPVSVFTWSANWYDFVCLVLNQPMGDIAILQNDFRGLVASRKFYLPFLTSTYVGPIVFSFAIFGFMNKSWKYRWLAAVLLFLFAVAAAGNNTPLAPGALKICPLLGAFRYPVKLMIFVAMTLVVAAAAGVQFVLAKNLRQSTVLTAAAGWLAALLVGTGLMYIPDFTELVRQFPWNRGVSIDMPLMFRAQVLFGQATVAASIVALLGLVIIELFRRERISRATFATLLVGLLAGQMLTAALQYARHTAPSGFYTQPSFAVDTIKKELAKEAEFGRLINLHSDPLVFPQSFKRKDVSYDVAFYQFTRQLLLSNIYVGVGIPAAVGYEAAETNEYKKLMKDATFYSSQTLKTPAQITRNDEPVYKFARLTATRLVGTHSYKKSSGKFVPMPQLPRHRFEMIAENKEHNYRLYKVLSPRPRAYLADEVGGVNDWLALRKMLVGDKEDSIDFGRVAWLKETDLAKLPADIRDGSGTEGKCWVDVSTPNELVVKTDSPRAALLVVADNFYPGWQCEVDSSPTEILCANAINRALPLPAGQHTVRFRYRPASLLIALSITLTTVAGLLLWFVFEARRRKVS